MASGQNADPKLVAKLAARLQRLRTKARTLKNKQIAIKRKQLKQRAKVVSAAITRLEKTLEAMKKNGAAAAAMAPIEARLDRYINRLGKLRKTLRKTRAPKPRRTIAERARLLKRALVRTQKRLAILGKNADPKAVKKLRMKLLMLQAKRLELVHEKKQAKKQKRTSGVAKLQQLAAEIHRLYDQLADLEDADGNPNSIIQLKRQILRLKRAYYRLRNALYPKKRSRISIATLRRIVRTIDRVESELESHADADEPDQIEVDRLTRRLTRLKAKRIVVRRVLREQRQARVRRARARVERVRRRITAVREQIEQTRQDPEGTQDELDKLQAKLVRLQAKEAALFAKYNKLKASVRRVLRRMRALRLRSSVRRSPFAPTRASRKFWQQPKPKRRVASNVRRARRALRRRRRAAQRRHNNKKNKKSKRSARRPRSSGRGGAGRSRRRRNRASEEWWGEHTQLPL